ncbi:hypothetical protein ACFQ5J_02430 [Lacticaseibacillus baoqingensis]|uniref:Uncharacterized protein n=1 Tax=Lacticaseibacillus baoqingensis TaxID=2486013 RepID=A0ABW4E470_9LACO|nr:hypothetical protein [Lacticaseibacillus baoqingensis]
MKIYYANSLSKRMQATVWVNDQVYTIQNASHIDVPVRRGDTVLYRVGKFAAKRPLHFQSPDAQFTIETNKRLQSTYMAGLLVLIMALWFMKQTSSLWVTILLLACVAGYELSNYFYGYTAKPVH